MLTKAMILRTSNPSNATSHISNRDWLKRKEEPGKTHRGRHQSKGLSLKDDAPPPSLLVNITRHAALLFSLLGTGGLRGSPHLTLANPMSSSRETEPPLWKLCWGAFMCQAGLDVLKKLPSTPKLLWIKRRGAGKDPHWEAQRKGLLKQICPPKSDMSLLLVRWYSWQHYQ